MKEYNTYMCFCCKKEKSQKTSTKPVKPCFLREKKLKIKPTKKKKTTQFSHDRLIVAFTSPHHIRPSAYAGCWAEYS